MPIKAKLVELIQNAILEEQSFIHSQGESGNTGEGSLEHWSAKDVLAHIRAWKENMIQGLEATAEGGSTAWDDDVDATNARLFELHRSENWQRVIAGLDATDRRLVEAVQMMSELELMDPGRNPWRNKRPAWVSIAGNGFTHPIVHIGQYAFEHGDAERGTRLFEMAADRLMKVDTSPNWQATAVYNLACAYAMGGQHERAIDHLRRALALNPDLTEWSKKDPDLVSLHANAEYLALYA
jgi:tetratricopeptide (TPR) repeat protein